MILTGKIKYYRGYMILTGKIKYYRGYSILRPDDKSGWIVRKPKSKQWEVFGTQRAAKEWINARIDRQQPAREELSR